MAGQLCGRCGESLTDGGCGCPPGGAVAPRRGQETDEPTTVIPAIGDPDLVRPYITPAEPQDAEQAGDDGADSGYGSSVVPGIDAPHLVRSSRARALAGQLAGPPDLRDGGTAGTAVSGPVVSGAVVSGAVVSGSIVSSTVATRTGAELSPADRGPGRRERANRRRTGRGRRAALIAAGALAVAGLGTAAALAPNLLNRDGTDQAQPQPGVTFALPTAGSPSASGSPAVVRPSSTSSAQPSPSATPSGSSTPSASPSGTPSSQAPHNNAPNSPSPTTQPGHGNPKPTQPATQDSSLRLGDTGPAVATLQSELSSLRVDHGLPASGTYDTRTQRDVSTFQHRYGVQGDPDGVFGPNSQTRMHQVLHQH